MMNRPRVSDDESPFVRTLVGHAGLPGSQVVTARSGSIFTLGERLGLSGNVYEAASADYTQPIVVKLFVDAVGADAADLDTFSREPLQASQLSHPNIIRVLEAGVLENGVPFVAMEKLSGQTLKEWLLHHGALSASMLRDVTRGAASALAAAHAVGIIHGAVRPDSIFLESNREGGARVQAGLVKLLDFGARSLTALSRSAEDDANRSESAPFLAPEQTEGGRTVLDARTDQFGLAATARAVLAYAPSRPSPAMDAVLRMACSRRPEDRFESIGRFVTALEEAAAGAALISGRAQAPRQLPDMDATPNGPMESPVAPVVMRKRPARIVTPQPPAISVSRQFFDEGERLSAEARAVVVEPDFSDSSLDLPVRRSGRWVAGLAAVVLAGGLGYGLSRFWQPLNGVTANARQALSKLRAGSTEPASVPAANAQPAPQPVTQPVGSAPSSAPAPAAAAAEPAVAPAANTAAPEAVPAAKPAPAPEPQVEPTPPAARPSRDDPEGEQDNARPSPAARIRAAAPTNESGHRAERDPLRGYVWSPRERRLVPAYRTMAPSDSVSPAAGGGSAASGQWATPPPPPMPSLAPAPAQPPTSYPSSSSPSATEPPAVAPPPLPDPIPAPRP